MPAAVCPSATAASPWHSRPSARRSWSSQRRAISTMRSANDRASSTRPDSCASRNVGTSRKPEVEHSPTSATVRSARASQPPAWAMWPWNMQDEPGPEGTPCRRPCITASKVGLVRLFPGRHALVVVPRQVRRDGQSLEVLGTELVARRSGARRPPPTLCARRPRGLAPRPPRHSRRRVTDALAHPSRPVARESVTSTTSVDRLSPGRTSASERCHTGLSPAVSTLKP